MEGWISWWVVNEKPHSRAGTFSAHFLKRKQQQKEKEEVKKRTET